VRSGWRSSVCEDNKWSDFEISTPHGRPSVWLNCVCLCIFTEWNCQKAPALGSNTKDGIFKIPGIVQVCQRPITYIDSVRHHPKARHLRVATTMSRVPASNMLTSRQELHQAHISLDAEHIGVINQHRFDSIPLLWSISSTERFKKRIRLQVDAWYAEAQPCKWCQTGGYKFSDLEGWKLLRHKLTWIHTGIRRSSEEISMSSRFSLPSLSHDVTHFAFGSFLIFSRSLPNPISRTTLTLA